MKKRSKCIITAFLLAGILQTPFTTFAMPQEVMTASLPPTKVFATETEEQALVEATVVRIVDGDTMVVSIGNTEYKVRLIGIDTPESVHPNADKNTEEGKKVSEIAKQMIPKGTKVWLESDVKDTDKYGRLLRYVYLDNSQKEESMLNMILLEEGLALPKTVPPNVKYQEQFTEHSRRARKNEKGLFKNAEENAEETPKENSSIRIPEKKAETISEKTDSSTAEMNTVRFVAKTSSGKQLVGGTWEILSADKKSMHTFQVTDTNNEFTVELPDGTYFLRQTKAPDGYTDDKRTVVFKLPYIIDGNRTELVLEPKVSKVEEKPEKPEKSTQEIAKTGAGLALPVGAGLLSAGILFLTKKRGIQK